MLSLLLLSCLLQLFIAPRHYSEIYKEEPVLSPSEADTPASLPSHLPAERPFHTILAARPSLNFQVENNQHK